MKSYSRFASNDRAIIYHTLVVRRKIPRTPSTKDYWTGRDVCFNKSRGGKSATTRENHRNFLL